ncbi:MAG TPA: hypothetical protein VGO25_02535 [Rhodanobacteraceae bacterium]|jgi:hypothetical protein|nr:hypothetical protein [Rhodanobacteraceae bacterium]
MNALVGNQSRNFERRFYVVISLVFVALVFWVFAHSFYLKLLFGTPALPLLLHIHGAVMSGWVVLLAVQSGLVAAHRVQWHRRLGVFGAGWAALVVLLGSVTTVHAAAREVRAHAPDGPMLVTIAGLELIQMLFFAALVTLAILLRRRTDYHKRLMVLTIACMLPSVLARLPVDFMSNGLIMLGLDAFVIVCVGIDTLRHRRLHPAFAWGGGLFIGIFHLALPLLSTPTWIGFGTRLLG